MRYRGVMYRIGFALVIAVALACCGSGDDARTGTWIAFRTVPGGADDGAIVVTDGEERLAFRAARAYSAVAWSPNGERVAAFAVSEPDGGQELSLVLFEVDAGREVEVDLGPLGALASPVLAWSPNGATIAAASAEAIWLFDREGEQFARYPIERQDGEDPGGVQLVWSEDSARVAVGVRTHAIVADRDGRENATAVDPRLHEGGDPAGNVQILGWKDGETLVLADLRSDGQGGAVNLAWECSVVDADEPCTPSDAATHDTSELFGPFREAAAAEAAFAAAGYGTIPGNRAYAVAGDPEAAAATDLAAGEVIVATPSGAVTFATSDLAPDFADAAGFGAWVAFYHREP